MRRRMYFLLPDVPTARQVVDELLLARIDDRHMHVLAKEGTTMEDLPQATLLQKSDFVHGVEQGLAVGGVTGVLAGLVAVTFPPAGLVLGGGAVLATALAGAGMGAWVSSMIGISAIIIVDTVIIFGRTRSRAPSITALRRSVAVRPRPSCCARWRRRSQDWFR